MDWLPKGGDVESYELTSVSKSQARCMPLGRGLRTLRVTLLQSASTFTSELVERRGLTRVAPDGGRAILNPPLVNASR